MSKKRQKPAPATAPARIPPPVDSATTDPDDVLSPALKDPAVWVGVGLVVLTAAVFAALRHFDFIGFDDPGYVKQNTHVTGGLTLSGITWAWTTGHAANWHPLTWMSHMFDAELFGLRPGGHHLTSVILHIVNVLLLFVLLKRATGALGPSAFTAALFAIHPLHVESVAWIAERKDVLSTMFWWLAMIAYVGYVQQPRLWRYLAVCLMMALGLLAKPMLVTLPLVLLLFDVWPLKRIQAGQPWTRLVLEKLPLFALAAASSVITFLVQQQGGAVTGFGLLPISKRIANALVAYLRYLGKTFWPADMAIFYPYSEALPGWWVAGSAVLLIALSFLAVRAVRRSPHLFVGWFWYVVTLVPVIGIVQVGTQAIADRYTYVPLVGIFMAIAWSAAAIAPSSAARRWALPAVATLVVLALATVAYAQVQVWQNNFTVWTHARAVTQDNYIAENELGVILVNKGQFDEALPYFERASAMKAEYVEARFNRGLAYLRRGRVADSIEQLSITVRLKPDHADAFNNLGFALMSTGKTDEALQSYMQALRLKPEMVDAHNNAGFVLAAAGRVPEAIAHFETAVKLAPDGEAGHMYLGMAYGAANRLDDAAREFREVVRINPASDGAKDQLAKIEALLKRRSEGRD